MKDLETERYWLRKPSMEDAEEIYEKWGTDKEQMAEYKEYNKHRNIIETRALLETAIKECEFGTPYWFIEEKETHAIVGYIKVIAASIKDKKCKVAFYFLEPWRYDNTPQEILRKVINYLFTERRIETIIMGFFAVRKENTEFLDKILKEIGMKREGILRNRLINSEGKKVNQYIYSILKEEWAEDNKQVQQK